MMLKTALKSGNPES